VIHTVEELARARGEDVTAIAAACARNARVAFPGL
jgi:hypothetical protein